MEQLGEGEMVSQEEAGHGKHGQLRNIPLSKVLSPDKPDQPDWIPGYTPPPRKRRSIKDDYVKRGKDYQMKRAKETYSDPNGNTPWSDLTDAQREKERKRFIAGQKRDSSAMRRGKRRAAPAAFADGEDGKPFTPPDTKDPFIIDHARRAWVKGRAKRKLHLRKENQQRKRMGLPPKRDGQSGKSAGLPGMNTPMPQGLGPHSSKPKTPEEEEKEPHTGGP